MPAASNTADAEEGQGCDSQAGFPKSYLLLFPAYSSS